MNFEDREKTKALFQKIYANSQNEKISLIYNELFNEHF